MSLTSRARKLAEGRARELYGPDATVERFRVDGVEFDGASSPSSSVDARVEVSCRVTRPVTEVEVRFTVE